MHRAAGRARGGTSLDRSLGHRGGHRAPASQPRRDGRAKTHQARQRTPCIRHLQLFRRRAFHPSAQAQHRVNPPPYTTTTTTTTLACLPPSPVPPSCMRGPIVPSLARSNHILAHLPCRARGLVLLRGSRFRCHSSAATTTTTTSTSSAAGSIREAFDSPFSYQHATTTSGSASRCGRPSTGRFRYDALRQPSDLLALSEKTQRRAGAIVQRILAYSPTAAGPSNPKNLELDLLVQVKQIDRLSDLLCSLIDLTELIRNIDEDPEWREHADRVYLELCYFMNELNVHVGLYEVGMERGSVGAWERGSSTACRCQSTWGKRLTFLPLPFPLVLLPSFLRTPRHPNLLPTHTTTPPSTGAQESLHSLGIHDRLLAFRDLVLDPFPALSSAHGRLPVPARL